MKKIGIIGAMPSELVDIRAALGEPKVENHARYDFYINEFCGKKIINACCGIGKVNAALCAQNLIDNYDVDCIINAGIAGGMDVSVKVCDIVISKDVMFHDILTRLLKEYTPFNGIFSASDELIKKAQKACSDNGINSFVGRIVSGEQFISDTKIKAEIKKDFNPLAVDMESAGVGQCAFRNDVPFVTIRCISDNADDEGEMSFDKFEKIAAKRVAEIVIEMIKEL
ncbi:MAG: 5'-methylthioadenosine/adenosylhomocysteine nucleosidase [Oscillospiraceae bacterium]